MKHTPLAAFVKYTRQQADLTQTQLAEKAGVGLRFVRDLEQGKETLRIDKINQVLALFGFEMRPDRSGIDPYEILMNYFNKGVVLTLKNKKKLHGILIREVKDNNHKIVKWEFVPNNNAVEYQKTQNPDLKTTIEQNDILEIELQK